MTKYPSRKPGPQQNPWGRKLSAEQTASRGATVSVHQSLFHQIRRAGYEGSAASTIAWALVKAVRPSMKDSKRALALLGTCPVVELDDVVVAVSASSASDTMLEPTRAELLSDITCMLRGLLEKAGRPVPAPSQALGWPSPSLSASPAPLAQSRGGAVVGGPKDSNDWVTPHTIASMEATWAAELETPDSATLKYRALVRALWRSQPLLLEQTMPGMEARGALWEACKEAVGA